MHKFKDSIIKKETQKTDIRNLAFSGGGTKGLMYTGAYEALDETGVLKDVEEIAGSSAGALIATLIACGVEAKFLTSILRTKPFNEFSRPTKTTNPFILALQSLAKINCIPLNEDNLPLQQFIEKLIRCSITQYIESNEFETRIISYKSSLEENLALLSNLAQNIADLKNKLTSENSLALEELNNFKTSNHKITFADLAFLRKIHPEKFKTLHITTTYVTNKEELEIFNAKTFPDISIAVAAGASSAFPGPFKSVQINNTDYYDGGIMDNIPIKYFTNAGRTLAFCFVGDDTKAYYNIFSSNSTAIIAKLASSFFRFYLNSIIGVTPQIEQNIQTCKYLRTECPLYTIILNPKDVGMSDIKKATKKFSELYQNAKATTLEHLNKHFLPKSFE